MANPGTDPDPADLGWGFLGRPRWILSHLFVVALLALFVTAGLWQLGRLSERRDQNALIEARSAAETTTPSAAVAAVVGAIAADPERAGAESAADVARPATTPFDPVGLALDYRVVADEGRFVESEIVRVANRSQNGTAGDWSVGLFETLDGGLILVNRGFIGRDVVTPPADDGSIRGWLRRSQIRDSVFGADDQGGDRVPRLDVAAIGSRLSPSDQERLAPVWLQLADPEVSRSAVLQPVPLPPIDEGNHLSYAVQWFTFTAMGAGAYGLVLRRKAHTGLRETELAPSDGSEGPGSTEAKGSSVRRTRC